MTGPFWNVFVASIFFDNGFKLHFIILEVGVKDIGCYNPMSIDSDKNSAKTKT